MKNLFLKSLLILSIFFISTLDAKENISSLKDNTFYMSIHREKGTPVYKFFELIYTELFSRLEIKLKWLSQPSKRASIELNMGRVDGIPARIFTYGEFFENVIRIEEPIHNSIIVAYMLNHPTIKLDGWKSLKNTDYRIEYLRGMKIAQNNLTSIIDSQNLSAISTSIQGLKRLASQRIDIYIDGINIISPLLKNNNFYKGIHSVGIMEEIPVYMYIHKKHLSLVPKLEATIKVMKEEGIIKELQEKAFNR